jgi:hypothetical protein
MISLKKFLIASGLDAVERDIKLVRHVDYSGRTLGKMIEAEEFDFYQAEQRADRKPFHGCKVVASFLASADGGCVFHGVYWVNGSRPLTDEDRAKAPGFLKTSLVGGGDRIWYDLEHIPGFDDLRGRLRVKWRAPLAWVQSKDMEIHEILPPGLVKHFSGYQEVLLTWKELQAICKHPASHPDWVTAMKFTAAIYRITDLSTGKIYIGSAYGKAGLWKRWCDYAATGNGGNVKLMSLDPANFQWSIVRTLSGVMSAAEVIRIEHTEMQKHGSKAEGLNWDGSPTREL